MGEWKPCDHCTDPMDCGSWAACINPRTKVNGHQHKPKSPPVELAHTRMICPGCGLGPDDCQCHPGQYTVESNPRERK